ncbi:MAG TPA: hypothetical protein VH764_18630 [Gemmatimonadales bacterium]
MTKKRQSRKPAGKNHGARRKPAAQPKAARRAALLERLDELRPARPFAARQQEVIDRLRQLVPDRPGRSTYRRLPRGNDARQAQRGR